MTMAQGGYEGTVLDFRAMRKYKVWVQIESRAVKADGEDLDEDEEPEKEGEPHELAEFDMLEEAQDAIARFESHLTWVRNR